MAVLDFCNSAVKTFQSSSLWIEKKLNSDPRLVSNIVKMDSNDCPNQVELEQEILARRKKQVGEYTNLEKADHPECIPEQYFFLGVTQNQLTQNLTLRSKPLMFRSRQKGNIDIVCRNLKEFSSYL